MGEKVQHIDAGSQPGVDSKGTVVNPRHQHECSQAPQKDRIDPMHSHTLIRHTYMYDVYIYIYYIIYILIIIYTYTI